MAENVLPPRQLGAGDTWGREIEKRLLKLTQDRASDKQTIANLNRTITAQATTLAQMNTGVTGLYQASEEQGTGGTEMADQINALRNDLNLLTDRLPVTRGEAQNLQGVAIAAGTSQIASISAEVPARKNRAVLSIHAYASLHKPDTTTLITRILVNGTALELPQHTTALSGRVDITLDTSREIVVEMGQTITISVQTTSTPTIPNLSASNPNLIQLAANIVFTS